jgi:hypothetical protein
MGDRCIDQVFLTSALVAGEWSASRSGCFAPGTHWIGGWVHHRTGLGKKIKILALLGLDPSAVQPVASCHTDCAAPYVTEFSFSPGICFGSRDSAVGIATGYGLDDRGVGVRVPVGSIILFSPRRPNRLWGLPSLLSNG